MLLLDPTLMLSSVMPILERLEYREGKVTLRLKGLRLEDVSFQNRRLGDIEFLSGAVRLQTDELPQALGHPAREREEARLRREPVQAFVSLLEEAPDPWTAAPSRSDAGTASNRKRAQAVLVDA